MNYIPRREPDYRREALKKRIEELRQAIRGGVDFRIVNAAEELRAAKLALNKAYRSKIETDSDVQLGRNPKRIATLMKKLAKLEREWQWWSTITCEEIVLQHSPNDASDKPGN